MATARRPRVTKPPSVTTVTVVTTELGPVGLACTEGAAVVVQLPERDRAATRNRLLATVKARMANPDGLDTSGRGR